MEFYLISVAWDLSDRLDIIFGQYIMYTQYAPSIKIHFLYLWFWLVLNALLGISSFPPYEMGRCKVKDYSRQSRYKMTFTWGMYLFQFVTQVSQSVWLSWTSRFVITEYESYNVTCKSQCFPNQNQLSHLSACVFF